MELKHFIEFRKMLHRFPDISGNESATRELVRAFVEPFSPAEIHEVGDTGLLLVYKGAQPGRQVLIRAELDGLPIAETNQFPHCSTYEGKSHACGHDGHMAVLARLAWLLHTHPVQKGTAYLLFQPAEENGEGARAVLSDPVFKKVLEQSCADASCAELRVLALHNIPGFTRGRILLRKGSFTPAVRSIIVRYRGKTSHAAEPEKGVSSAPALAAFLQQALAMTHTATGGPGFFLVSPVYMHMGEKSYGVTAGNGEIHLTIRAWTNQLLDKKAIELEALAQSLGDEYKLGTEIRWTERFEANENDVETVHQVQTAATALGMETQNLSHPMKWGEDFGLFTRQFRGAMFGIGSGETHPALHNPDYDFEDSLIAPTSDLFEKIISDHLSQ